MVSTGVHYCLKAFMISMAIRALIIYLPYIPQILRSETSISLQTAHILSHSAPKFMHRPHPQCAFSFLASGYFYCLLITFASSLDRKSALIWIQTV